MSYCIDTSSLMDAWCRWYPLQHFPTLWEHLDKLIQSGNLISSEEVLRELERKEDALCAWAKDRDGLFLPLTDEIQAIVTEIMSQFRTLVDPRTGKSFADPFVIATAHATDSVVVTGESPTGSHERPKIPDVCEYMNIPWIGTVGLIAEEGWTF